MCPTAVPGPSGGCPERHNPCLLWSEEDGFLVGCHEAKERETHMLLGVLCDMYGRWLDKAPTKEPAQSLWERYKDKWTTRSGKAVGKLFY